MSDVVRRVLIMLFSLVDGSMAARSTTRKGLGMIRPLRMPLVSLGLSRSEMSRSSIEVDEEEKAASNSTVTCNLFICY